jgi:hypothetical protein
VRDRTVAGGVGGLSRLKRVLERAASRLEDIVVEIDALAKEVEDVEGFPETPGVTAPPRSRRRRSPQEQRVLRAEADAGVASLRLAWHADGSAELSVNGRPGVRLAPKLATLVAILATPGRYAEDGLPAWRDKGAVAAELSKRTGRTLRARDVTRDIYKLRRVLDRAGENEHIVVTNRRGGVRLAVRAPATDPGK